MVKKLLFLFIHITVPQHFRKIKMSKPKFIRNNLKNMNVPPPSCPKITSSKPQDKSIRVYVILL